MKKSINKYTRLLSNTLILGLGVFGSKLLVFLMMPLYTDILSPEEYSLADLISQTANLIMPLACIGITDGVFRFTLDSNRDKRSVISSGLSIMKISAIVLIAVWPLLFLISSEIAYVGGVVAAYVLAANLHSLFAQYVRAQNKTKLFAIQGILNTALVIIFNVLMLVVFPMGVMGYVLSVVVADLLVSIFLLIVGGLYKDIKPEFCSRETKKALLKYSIPMIPATIFWWITSVSDRYMVTWFSGGVENGLYTAAYKIPTMLSLVSNVFIEAWQYSAVSEGEGREAFFGRVFEYYQSIIFLASSAIIAMAQPFIIVLCADNYFEAWRFVPVLAISAAFSGLTAFFGSVYLVKKKSMLTFITSMTGALVNIALNLILIPQMGAQGAAIATAISYGTVFVMRAVNTRKYVRFSLHTVRMILNLVLLSAQTFVILTVSEYMIPLQIGFLAAMVIVNIKPLIDALRMILKIFLKKRKKSEKV